MTMGTKYPIPHSLTTPPCGHPSNGGELLPQRDEDQVPLGGGVARSAGVVITTGNAPMPTAPGGGNTSNELRVTSNYFPPEKKRPNGAFP